MRENRMHGSRWGREKPAPVGSAVRRGRLSPTLPLPFPRYGLMCEGRATALRRPAGSGWSASEHRPRLAAASAASSDALQGELATPERAAVGEAVVGAAEGPERVGPHGVRVQIEAPCGAAKAAVGICVAGEGLCPGAVAARVAPAAGQPRPSPPPWSRQRSAPTGRGRSGSPQRAVGSSGSSHSETESPPRAARS